MTTVTCVEDMRQLYRRRVPRMFYDYAESGSYTESTFRRNETDFQSIQIRQRVGIDISDIDTSTRMAGAAAAIPAGFAPVGMLGIQNAGGEIKVARAARDFGVPFTLSTMSICSMEQVAEATGAPFWFQLYVVKDREFVRDLIQRAKAAKCSALVVTMDLSMLGQRHKDIKNQLSIRPNLRNLLNIATKPGWAYEMARTPYRSFGNVIGHAKGVDDLSSLLVWAAEMVDPALDWKDIEWIRKEWGGPIILKGIMDVEDARIAAELDIRTIVVSNHGGRQLDGAGSSIRWLPRIADAVGERVELMLDSGVRSGMDIFRARALGASGVLLGRAMVYALGAQGQAGVTTLLNILQKELRTTMGLAGKVNTQSIGRDDVIL
ncbi:alpha-hydroxy acid oxidase [Paracoccus seriniphilus]|uniref:L-lactate dehydrogenase (Cytochrome) n=1 Tax=Paracoccus seriniphilus TaxID=184748 RepID=A0A239Q018_9RHOB|nr:alpha-hydroxy acid oxidase [Paracoccus seriniphilus]WCR16307.1 alpha-hydroxy-acid oxidizing protein [Paracoccus seriniphilus]SNT75845.1 L-lactate dehydrogenase (cytochrome) [Paracoccus seriniphilus]